MIVSALKSRQPWTHSTECCPKCTSIRPRLSHLPPDQGHQSSMHRLARLSVVEKLDCVPRGQWWGCSRNGNTAMKHSEDIYHHTVALNVAGESQASLCSLNRMLDLDQDSQHLNRIRRWGIQWAWLSLHCLGPDHKSPLGIPGQVSEYLHIYILQSWADRPSP